MRALSIFLFSVLFISPQITHCQTVITDSVVVANRGYEWEANNSPASGSLRGTNYIVKGYILPGNYFDVNCPANFNCGVVATDSLELPNGEVVYFGLAEDTTIVIGDWDCRGFFSLDDNFWTDGGGIIDHSTQTYRLYEGKQSICPGGCTIVTEGPLVIVWPPDGEDPNIVNRDRTIAGGTNEAKFFRGDLEHTVYNKLGQGNGLGGTNHKTVFHYVIEEENEPSILNLDVSVKGASLILDGSLDSLGNPKYGTAVILEGVIYKGGAFSLSGNNSGIDPNGNAEFDSIGTWVATGWWNAKNQTLQDGFFAATKQTFEFNHDELGLVQIMTEGWDITGTGTNKRLVVGATDSLSGYRGDCNQEMVGFNISGGFNLSYTFEIQKQTESVGIRELPKSDKPYMKLFPIPATDKLTVGFKNMGGSDNYLLEIIDVTGKLVTQKKLHLNPGMLDFNLDVSVLSPGWYSLILKEDEAVITSSKFIKD